MVFLLPIAVLFFFSAYPCLGDDVIEAPIEMPRIQVVSPIQIESVTSVVTSPVSCEVSILLQSLAVRKEAWLKAQREAYAGIVAAVQERNKGKKRDQHEEAISFPEFLKWDQFFSEYVNQYDAAVASSKGYQELRQKVEEDLPNAGRFLVLGSGVGHIAVAISNPQRQIVAVDRSAPVLWYARHRLAQLTGDSEFNGNDRYLAINSNFAREASVFGDKFSVAVLVNVLHLLNDEEIDFVFSHIAASMRKHKVYGGRLVVSVPKVDSLTGSEEYYPRSAPDISQAIRKHGFISQKDEVIEADGTHFLTFVLDYFKSY